MISAPLPKNEAKRLQALLRYEVLDTDDEQAFDDLTELASAICGTSISLISLVDSDRQWFKSRVGLEARETERGLAFCAHAILQKGIFEVPNATDDERFADNPLVTGAPDIRFYAGEPLVTPDGEAIGTLCVIDQEPKKLTEEQSNALRTLAKQVISQLELRLHNRQLIRMQKNQEQFIGAMAHDLRSPFNGILGLSRLLVKKSEIGSPDEVAVISNAILDSSLKVYQILDESLQWARNQLGATHIKMQGFELQPVINQSLELILEGFDLKHISLQRQVESGLKPYGDPALTKVIIRNLLANAMKFAPEGSQAVLKVESIDKEVHISVIDQGPGVPPDIKEQLFNECVTSTVGSKGEMGNGLGLMLCAQFAQQQQGQLWLDESHVDGCKITLKLKQSD